LTKAPSIGIAGCGAMGLPMAQNLLSGGFEVWGYDIRPKEEFEGFSSRMRASAADLATDCPTVISVVRDWSQTIELCFEEQGLFTGNVVPKTLVVSSTLSPGLIHELRTRIPDTTHLVDAPMSGAPYRAIDGTLTFMVGGERPEVDKLMPAFSTMGSEITHLGALGSGMTCKVLNNMLAATSVIAVREIMEAAEKLDFPTETLLRIARTSSGSTWFGDNIEKISWADEGYSIANTIGILEKDVHALLDATEKFPELRINGFADFIVGELRNLTPVAED
jgi:3-hydroxyisobutyrate dehydrogenase-like beta-hydroxyacid dehydrogenase